MKKIGVILLLFIAAVVVVLVFAQKKDQEVIAVIEYILTGPDEMLVDAFQDRVAGEGSAEDFNIALNTWGEGFVVEEALQSQSNRFRGEIVELYFAQMVLEDYTVTPQSMSVRKTSDRNYTYEALVQTSFLTDERVIKGNIQFDEKFLVNYMTCDFFLVYPEYAN